MPNYQIKTSGHLWEKNLCGIILHWTLVHQARKQLIKIMHACIGIQVSKPSIHNDPV
jgi:hypothetical protein